MKKKHRRKTTKINSKKVLMLIFLVAVMCLVIHPIQILKSNLFKPMSVAANANGAIPNRYSQTETEKSAYIDATGKEYNTQFETSLPNEVELSYEQIIEDKSLLIAKMKDIPQLNYEMRYLKKYDYVTQITADILRLMKRDSTISATDSVELAAIWGQIKTQFANELRNGKYRQVTSKDYKSGKLFVNTNNLFVAGKTYATTRSLVTYIRNATVQTVENGGILPGEAYLMASNRNQSTSLDVDKIQQAVWMISEQVESLESIPSEFLGINPEASVVGDNVANEAKALNDYNKDVKAFKESHVVDGVETEIYDNMLKQYSSDSDQNYYESDVAGLVVYDEAEKEFVVGPFSVDYIRSVFIPEKGGQNENQNKEGTIVFNSITDAEVYGLNSKGEEVKLKDWNFVFPDVEYDLKAKKAVRIAEINANNKGDISPNIYPYPNENFYISFKDANIDAVTKIEFTTNNMNAEAEVYLYEGSYQNITWQGASDGNKTYLEASPLGNKVKSADIYQIKSASIIMEKKTIKISVGKYHEKYNDYCIPLTMEFAGNVWYDGSEIEKAKDPNKVFGVRDKNENGDYTEYGMADIIVNLYNENNQKIASTITDKNGDYIFKYVKIGPKYYLEFLYDGMKYKATTYLNGEDDNNGYKSSDQFSNYLDYSHVKEDDGERTAYNNSFTEIKNGNTRTSGQAVSNTGTVKDILYTVQNYDESYIGGTADIDRYNISARSTTTGLLYPLQNSYVITSKDISLVDPNQKYLNSIGVKNIFVLGRLDHVKNENFIVNTKQGEANKDIAIEDNFETEQTINYTMVDEYLHHINLGLVERAPIDLATKIDLVQTKTTLVSDVSEPNIGDFGKRDKNADTFDIITRSNAVGKEYFSETYSQELEYSSYIYRHDFTDNPNSIENDNLQMFMQYKMTVKNQSEITSGYITELANYYSDDLYYPVDQNEVWRYYDKNTNYVFDYKGNGEKGYGNITIPQIMTTYCSWAVKNTVQGEKVELGQVIWNSNSKFGKNNNRNLVNTGLNGMYTNSFQDVMLEPGETIDIYIYYKVEQKENSTIKNGYGQYISNDNAGGGKKNIVEINSYKSLDVSGGNGGRVDKDSAPGNAEIGNFISYEDNIDSAPYFRVLVNGETNGKSIIGYVWEDEADKTILVDGLPVRLGEDFSTTFKNNQRRGNGKIDLSPQTNRSLENYINNVLVELIRLEYNQSTGEYEQVEFTEKYKQAYPEKYTQVFPQTGELLAKDSTQILTWTGPYSGGYNTGRPVSNGQYRFDNLVEGGKYKVRFTYGTENEIRTEIASGTVYSGQDYKSTQYNGRIDVKNLEDPSTEVMFVVDTYDFDNEGNGKEIIELLKNLNGGLKKINSKIKIGIYAYGKDGYRKCANFDELLTGTKPADTLPAYEAIYAASTELIKGSAENKVLIIYNEGEDPRIDDGHTQLSNFINDGGVVIGLAKDIESLEMCKFKNKKQDVKTYMLDSFKEDMVYEIVTNKIIENKYLASNVSHCEDYLQNDSYYTMQGNLRTVTGRLEVMKYSQNMTAEIADTLNVEYMKTLNRDFSSDSELSQAIKKLANYTQMTADSYEISMSFSDDINVEKTINLGLQQIPERDIEVTNEVDNIIVKLANGEKIIDLREDKTKNVQEIKDKLFTIYMDEEIMQGATIEVTYKLNISNLSDIDTLYTYVEYATDKEKQEWYTALTGENVPLENIDEVLLKTEPIKISKVYSYYDNLVFRAENNNKWEILNKTVETVERERMLNVKRDDLTGKLLYLNERDLYDSRANVRDSKVVWSQTTDLNVVDRNKDRVQKYSVIETSSFKDIELYPNNSKEVIDNLNSNSNSRPVSTVCTYLVLSKTLSSKDLEAKDALSYRNYIEIAETSSNTGRRDYNGAEASFTGDLKAGAEELTSENDIDAAERIIILPPFGDKKIAVWAIVGLLVVLGCGIIFIKKRVL